MEIQLRQDSVIISGYVNAIERKSKRIRTRLGEFEERINKGAFERAIERNEDIKILLNHNWERVLGGTKTNLKLTEDNIGLRAEATITDAEVIDKARKRELVGWSFGFRDIDVANSVENGVSVRDVKDLDLREVSILDNTRNPAYEGTLVQIRDDEVTYIGDAFVDEIEVREEPKKIDYSEIDAELNKLRELRA